MNVRGNIIYKATQYNKRGDHPLEHVWSVVVPILDEEPGKPWPETGRLGTLDDCYPVNLRYSVYLSSRRDDCVVLKLGDWILESEGEVVRVVSNEKFQKEFQEV